MSASFFFTRLEHPRDEPDSKRGPVATVAVKSAVSAQPATGKPEGKARRFSAALVVMDTDVAVVKCGGVTHHRRIELTHNLARVKP